MSFFPCCYFLPLKLNSTYEVFILSAKIVTVWLLGWLQSRVFADGRKQLSSDFRTKETRTCTINHNVGEPLIASAKKLKRPAAAQRESIRNRSVILDGRKSTCMEGTDSRFSHGTKKTSNEILLDSWLAFWADINWNAIFRRPRYLTQFTLGQTLISCFENIFCVIFEWPNSHLFMYFRQ